MAKPKVQLYNSFDEWRIITNTLSDEIGDLALGYTSDGSGEHAQVITQPTDLVVAINDLNARKVKRSGDTMTGSMHFNFGTLTASNPFVECFATWNNAGVNFSGLLVDITNTASGSGSLLADFRLAGVQKFGIDVNGAVVQKLTGSYMARDVVSGSRHVREYQDLNDASANGLPATKIEWGFTWNAGWNGSTYIKDRSNAGDHAIMHRVDNGYRDQYWFSDGSVASSAIAFVKKIDWDFVAQSGWIDLNTTIVRDFTVGANKLTVASASGNTAVAGTLTVAGITQVNNALTVTSSTSLNTLSVSSTSQYNGLMTINAGSSFVGGTVTANTPIINATQTWNNSGTTFSLITVDITETAAASGSLILDFKTNGLQKFGVGAEGQIIQKLSGLYLARDIVSGSRHVREYQDLSDNNANGLPNTKIEWGYTWNAKWSGTSYIKDRSNVGDHAIMERVDSTYKTQFWFSDGSSAGSAIAFVKKYEFDPVASTYWLDTSLNVIRDFAVNTNKFNVTAASGNTAVAGTLSALGNFAVNTNKFTVDSTTGDSVIGGTLSVAGNLAIATNKFTVDTVSGNTVVAGTFNTTGAGSFASTLSTTGDFAVNTNKFNVTASSGNTTVAGTLSAAGNFAVNTNKFTVDSSTGNTLVAGTLNVTGAGTFNSTLAVTNDFSVATNKFTVDATTGNTAVFGTLGVTGIFSVGSLLNINPTTGTTTVASGAITASTPIFNLSQTWNNAGVTFTGIKFNLTNTASNEASLLLDFQLAGAPKFGVSAEGSIIQKLSGKFLARDVVSGSRHIREYQDLPDNNANGMENTKKEWGFTWNAKWTGTEYVKDRSNAGDHAIMHRLDSAYNYQWWFSDGASINSPIAWVKKLEFNAVTNNYKFKDGANETIITPTSVTTQIANISDKLVVGSISYFDAVETTTATVTETIIASFAVGTYRSATFEIQAVDTVGAKFHRSNLTFIHNGSQSDSVEYGSINIGGLCATYTARLNAGNVEILATPTSTNNTVYKIHIRLMGA